MMIALENDDFRIDVLPQVGARIDQIFDKKAGKNWIWHPPGYAIHTERHLPLGASFDENWTGGWDEIFPNDAPGPFQDFSLVDHGEFWSQSWQLVESSLNLVTCRLKCQTVPVSVEKTILIEPGSNEAELRYTFSNESEKPLPFLFKMHAALQIEENDRLRLPRCQVEAVDLGFSTLIGKPGRFQFPWVRGADNEEVDLSQIPGPQSEKREFFYASQLERGECGIYNHRTQTSLEMRFQQKDFPFVWGFASFGGWKNHYLMVLESSTTMPWDLNQALQNGTCAILEPYQIQQRSLFFKITR